MFLCVDTHVFVLIQKCVYVFLNRIKTSAKNIMNPAAKVSCRKFKSGLNFFVCFLSLQ